MKKKFKIPQNEIKELLGTEKFEFPKYSTQILNIANQNAQGTRPAIVGKMSELIKEFSGQTIDEWEEWYLQRHPHAIDKASNKIKEMIDNFKDVIDLIDDEMIRKWVKDLVIIKTFIGLKFQEAILSKVAGLLEENYTLASPQEESKGIDGYIGKKPVSIKPDTYKSKPSLQESINVKFIYYKKANDGITVDIEDFL
jgi:hypothetical protein